MYPTAAIYPTRPTYPTTAIYPTRPVGPVAIYPTKPTTPQYSPVVLAGGGGVTNGNVVVNRPYGDQHSQMGHMDIYNINGMGTSNVGSANVYRPYGDQHTYAPHVDSYRPMGDGHSMMPHTDVYNPNGSQIGTHVPFGISVRVQIKYKS